MSLSQEFQALATDLLSEFDERSGDRVIQLERTETTWNPTTGAPTLYPLLGTVLGVAKEYIDGTTILATDLTVRCGVFDVEPDMSGKVIIDGKPHDIIRIMPKPAAGTTVAWELIIRA